MEELYRMIEKKIADAGYEKTVSGEEVYEDICDEIEGKENGAYICLVKKEGNVHFEYTLQVMDEEFNLSSLTIIDGDRKVFVDFDH